ncbi:hypothetical protein MPSEU_000764700 [Mayamaea pseudoterrestris]|nr:hypothetical protein MPSEU_000764700 [Mayamaea pseudoterrestris]
MLLFILLFILLSISPFATSFQGAPHDPSLALQPTTIHDSAVSQNMHEARVVNNLQQQPSDSIFDALDVSTKTFSDQLSSAPVLQAFPFAGTASLTPFPAAFNQGFYDAAAFPNGFSNNTPSADAAAELQQLLHEHCYSYVLSQFQMQTNQGPFQVTSPVPEAAAVPAAKEESATKEESNLAPDAITFNATAPSSGANESTTIAIPDDKAGERSVDEPADDSTNVESVEAVSEIDSIKENVATNETALESHIEPGRDEEAPSNNEQTSAIVPKVHKFGFFEWSTVGKTTKLSLPLKIINASISFKRERNWSIVVAVKGLVHADASFEREPGGSFRLVIDSDIIEGSFRLFRSKSKELPSIAN